MPMTALASQVTPVIVQQFADPLVLGPPNPCSKSNTTSQSDALL